MTEHALVRFINSVKNLENKTVYCKETVRCQHLIVWQGSQGSVHCHTTALECCNRLCSLVSWRPLVRKHCHIQPLFATKTSTNTSAALELLNSHLGQIILKNTEKPSKTGHTRFINPWGIRFTFVNTMTFLLSRTHGRKCTKTLQ
jgi:hypothetical protein